MQVVLLASNTQNVGLSCCYIRVCENYSVDTEKGIYIIWIYKMRRAKQVHTPLLLFSNACKTVN